MSSLKKKVHLFAKKASSIERSREVVHVVSRSEIAELNKTIEPKIRQNESERTASMNAAARCIVGRK